MKSVLLTMVLTPALCFAQAPVDVLPDAPAVKPVVTHVEHESNLTKIAFVSSITARTADTIYTCRQISQNWQEKLLPVKSCGGVAAWNAASVAAGYGGQKLFHRLGWHKLESLPHWISVAGSASGIVYSLAHTKRR